MKKKILHILNSSIYSGAENVVITIINHFKEDYECAYASLDGPIRNVLESNEITYLPIKKTSISEIRRIVKLYKPDVIHAHDFRTSIITAASRINVPIISHLHNNSPWLKTYHPFSFAYLLSSTRYSRILTVSSSVLDEYVFGKWITKKSLVVSNPIDISVVKKKAETESDEITPIYDMVFIGRFTAQKNIPRLIKITNSLVKDKPNFRACLIGSGELFDEIVKMINHLGLQENITLTGFLENPYKILAKSKVLCITSDWEGFGLVAVEALALGVPIVATPVGGLPGIVGEKCGKLCKTDEEFVQEIEKLLSDNVYRQMKSKGALNRAQELNNIKEYLKQIERIYMNGEQVLKGNDHAISNNFNSYL